MIHDPAVLILDEPANGLDPRARIELREMIRALAADGKTVLVSSHILARPHEDLLKSFLGDTTNRPAK